MEKFYIVTDKSPLRKDYIDYEENRITVNKIINEFFKKYGIESKKYFCSSISLMINPTESDEANFKKDLCIKAAGNGLVGFKKNSQVLKDWVKTLKDQNIKVISKPHLTIYFSTFGQNRSRIFSINNTVYCSYEAVGYEDFNNPEGMTEIKASEFFKIIEDYNESLK